MTARSFLCALALTTLVTAACDRSIPADPDPVAFSQARKDLPFHLSGDAVLVGREVAPNAGPPDFGQSTFDGRCSEPADMLMRFEVSGQASYLGEVTGVVEHCTQLDFTTLQTAKITDGIMIWTAANGDELWGQHERPEGESAELVEWVGGTGRFASASGNAVSRPECNQAAGTCTLEIDGVLVYTPAP